MHRLVVVLLAFAVSAYGSPAADRIIGGSDASFWNAPYQVSLQNTLTGHFCGGSIIGRRWILTTAGCVNRYQLLPNLIQVNVGSNSLGGGLTFRATDVVIHPGWNLLAPRRNDIGLVRLRTPLVYTSRIQPIALPTEDFTEADYPAVLTGWGTNGEIQSEPQGTLQRITVNVIAQRSCLLRAIGTTSTNLCTETVKEESGACDGDNGGPLVADRVQIGILSSATFPCASGRPDIHTRVWSFVDWINETMNGKVSEEEDEEEVEGEEEE